MLGLFLRIRVSLVALIALAIVVGCHADRTVVIFRNDTGAVVAIHGVAKVPAADQILQPGDELRVASTPLPIRSEYEGTIDGRPFRFLLKVTADSPYQNTDENEFLVPLSELIGGSAR